MRHTCNLIQACMMSFFRFWKEMPDLYKIITNMRHFIIIVLVVHIFEHVAMVAVDCTYFRWPSKIFINKNQWFYDLYIRFTIYENMQDYGEWMVQYHALAGNSCHQILWLGWDRENWTSILFITKTRSLLHLISLQKSDLQIM